MKSEVFNNVIGSPYDFFYPSLTDEQNKQILAALFEQLLIFDSITISTNKINFALAFLINRLDINTVEKLIDFGYIKFMIWSPVINSVTGSQRDDGSIDESRIYGIPPILAGSLTKDDLDPEKNIQQALSHFSFHRDRKRSFTKTALRSYIIPDGMEFATDSARLIIDAYQNNSLSSLGLPFEKEANQLDLNQRKLLLDLGHKILEIAILSKYNLKSYENYEHFEICKQNFQNIGKAYKVAENCGVTFNLENLPNLKSLFLQGKIEFESVFKIRHLSNAKYYRKWINKVGENCNAQEITNEYLKEIKGKYKFVETTEGKLLKNLSVFGISTALGTLIAGTGGAAAGFAFGLLETFWIENILKGRNPSMFIEKIKSVISNKT